MPGLMRVAYTFEQCWHDVPGGTATSALHVARRLAGRTDVELVGVAGRHRRPPDPAYRPPVPIHALPLARPWLYETWNRFGWPTVERTTGPVDVCHSTVAIPAATEAPHVVTVHDVAFLNAPERFTSHGARTMRAGLERCRQVDLVLCPSRATGEALLAIGFDEGRLRVVPWGVEAVPVSDEDRARVRTRYGLPDRYVLFVGTLEPRKNLMRLAEAVARLDTPPELVVAGAEGWGDALPSAGEGRFVGFVPNEDLPAVYAGAAAFAYPSLEEGFGMPIAEAMAYGVPVVTSRGSATEEVAGGAAVLVDATDVESIAAGLDAALADDGSLRTAGLARAGELSWDATVEATLAAYREVVR